MKAIAGKFLPFLLILAGGLRLLWERFPGRLGFLRVLGGEHYGWVFWTLGLAGLLWLVLPAVSGGSEAKRAEETGVSGLRRFFSRYGIEAAILLVTAVSLSMLIRSGYFWDDAVNSTAYLAEKKDSVPLLQHVLDFMKEYLHLGRINVLSFYYYFFFYIDNVSVYKALIILTILIDQLIFRKVLLEFGVPLPGARLGMLLIPMLLQTRAYQDPVSGFYGLMQVLTAEMLLCAYFTSRWLRSGKKRELVRGLLFFTAGLLTYEVCFPFLLMICLLIWIRRKNFLKAVRDSLPFAGAALLMLEGVVLVRAKYVTDSTYAGVAFSLDPSMILRAGFRQLTAALPLSFYSAGYQASVMTKAYPAAEIMRYDFGGFLSAVSLTDVLILAAALWILHRIRGQASGIETAGWKGSELALLGLSFAVLPCVTVAMSQRYQGQLMPGLGYLPVYIQYFGIAVLLLWAVLSVRPSAGKRALCVSAFALVLLLNLQNNRAVTAIMNRSFYGPRNAGEAALRGGILDFLPEGAVLISDNDRAYLWEADWNNRGLYREFYGNNSRHCPETAGDYKLLREAADAALAAGSVPDEAGRLTLEPENVWLISYWGDDARGLAKLGRLRSAAVDAKKLAVSGARTDRVLWFVSGEAPEQAGVVYTAADGTFRQTGTGGQRVRWNAHGILYALPEDEVILFESLTADLFIK